MELLRHRLAMVAAALVTAFVLSVSAIGCGDDDDDGQAGSGGNTDASLDAAADGAVVGDGAIVDDDSGA